MYDPATSALIRSSPDLDGLEREDLPKQLSSAFAEIATARLKLRLGHHSEFTELEALISRMKRLAFTNETLVSVSPNREDRAAAAFVAASAHQLCINAERLSAPEGSSAYLHHRSISSDISAMLLFLVAEATADAEEIARSVRWSAEINGTIEGWLIGALRDVARGRLQAIVDRALPKRGLVEREEIAETASLALYFRLLEGVQRLAAEILSVVNDAEGLGALEIFTQVRDLAKAPVEEEWLSESIGTFAGPHHLASLLIAAAIDLKASAICAVPPPTGVDADKWKTSVKRFAASRPFLWRNHRDAIEKGYLNPGVSAAIGFPTGAGKSTLAELKINATLLMGRKAIFLAPTNALVDQTTNALRRAFPTATVEREKSDALSLFTGEDELPEIFVMTPEACLTQLSLDASVLEDVGLLVFDECHLMHPNDEVRDRRPFDAMLCLLFVMSKLPSADIVLLSAMMKNTDELAKWVADTTGRECLSLALSWKPTRQLRGSVVYEQGDLDVLRKTIAEIQGKATTQGPSVDARNAVSAAPLGFFSLKQTWETTSSGDYVLMPLIAERPLLAVGQTKGGPWYLTPNAGVISAAIAVAASVHGVKTLIFFQTIKNARSASDAVSDVLGDADIELTEEQLSWLDGASLEMGGPNYLYIRSSDGRVTQRSAVHHGLLLQEERFLIEALYKRVDGLSVLAATSTLAQGMNLPSEFVIIAEDSRYNDSSSRREVLEAQDLLNAAGRAGRAGQSANGIVLVVPGRVVGVNYEEKTIGAHWITLQKIFGQSDQCLDIDDPLTALLDRVEQGKKESLDLSAYVVGKLAAIGATADGEDLESVVTKSLTGFRARQRGDSDWVSSRVAAAREFLSDGSSPSESAVVEQQVAASLGVPLSVVTRISDAMLKSALGGEAAVGDWVKWFFEWMKENADLFESVLRQQSLEELFGKTYKDQPSAKQKAEYAVPKLAKLADLWMQGKPLCELELAIGTKADKLKTCDRARRFVLRIVPDLAYLTSLPSMLAQRRATVAGDEVTLPPALSQLGRCVRLGYNSVELLALNDLLRSERPTRRQVHESLEGILHYLPQKGADESWDELVMRIEIAMMNELNSRG